MGAAGCSGGVGAGGMVMHASVSGQPRVAVGVSGKAGGVYAGGIWGILELYMGVYIGGCAGCIQGCT